MLCWLSQTGGAMDSKPYIAQCMPQPTNGDNLSETDPVLQEETSRNNATELQRECSVELSCGSTLLFESTEWTNLRARKE